MVARVKCYFNVRNILLGGLIGLWLTIIFIGCLWSLSSISIFQDETLLEEASEKYRFVFEIVRTSKRLASRGGTRFVGLSMS